MAAMKVTGVSKLKEETEAAKSLIGQNKFISRADAEQLERED